MRESTYGCLQQTHLGLMKLHDGMRVTKLTQLVARQKVAAGGPRASTALMRSGDKDTSMTEAPS